MKLAAWVSVQKAWSNLSVREKSLTSWAATLLGAAVLWTWGLAPAMKIQHVDPAIGAALQAQTQALQQLQVQAQALQKTPRTNALDAGRVLQSSAVQLLGSTTRLSAEGQRATLTLSSASAESLAEFLNQARLNAQALPIEAHLQKIAPQQGTAPAPLWRGVVIFSLPGG